MIDEERRLDPAARETATPLETPPPVSGARGTAPRHPVAGGRIAAAGIGIAAMLGLVATMEVADGQTGPATPVPSRTLGSESTATIPPRGVDGRLGRLAAAEANRPIVLTPRAVVRSVSVPAPGGPGGSGSAAAPAPAPVAAPVASTSGSQ